MACADDDQRVTQMTYSSETLDQCADRIVRQEVMCCLSSIVSTLANGYGNIGQNRPDNGLADLAEQALELCCPVSDYEEAATEAGWMVYGSVWQHPEHEAAEVSAENACHTSDIEPYEREVFEHWAVTQWLADKLREHGERVDDDFGDLCVWARTTTGQGIAMDGVIREIAKAIVAPAPSKPRSWADAIVRGVPSQAAWRAAIAPKT